MCRRTLLACAAVWALSLIACCFPDEKTKPAAQPSAPEPPQESAKANAPPKPLDPDLLLKEFRSDPGDANRKYVGVMAELAGVVNSQGFNVVDGPFVIMEPGPKGILVAAWFPKSLKTEIAALPKGQRIRVRGVMDKGVLDKANGSVEVQLLDCALLDSGDSTTTQRPAEKTTSPSPDDARRRKTIFLRLNAIDAEVEAAAVKKYGRKPKPDDAAGVAVPFKVFVERETEKALDALTKNLTVTRSELAAIRKEGDENGWPKKVPADSRKE